MKNIILIIILILLFCISCKKTEIVEINYNINNFSDYESTILIDQKYVLKSREYITIDTSDRLGYYFIEIQIKNIITEYVNYSLWAPPDAWFGYHDKYNVIIEINNDTVIFKGDCKDDWRIRNPNDT